MTCIDLTATRATGNIAHLESLPKLIEIYLSGTGVTGDEEEFNEYRESERLEECYIELYLT
ncbi:MAG: hypothetical protein CMP83_10540 [Gammaproteobacteria bacterium]|nr:hypothetical protein [Gammaproteobacteria bacterium]